MAEQKKSSNQLCIAGGGSGGHVLAGIAIADAWIERQHSRDTVLFVGAKLGLESRLVPQNQYALKVLNLGSFNRVKWTRKIRSIVQLPLACLRAAFLLLLFRPTHIVGVGGYASGPVVLMGMILCRCYLLKTRIAILEQNAVPGFTNRILRHFVHQVFTTFPNMEEFFPGTPVQWTGNPIRSVMKACPSRVGQKPVQIFIFGGSQGALGVNTLILQTLPKLKDLKIQWVHQTGQKDVDRVTAAYEQCGIPARVEAFITDMYSVYAESSFVICRAGSSTLAELSAVGRTAILVPLPTAADHHQEKNALLFEKAGAAKLFHQSQSPEELAALILALIRSPELLMQMEERVIRFCKKQAAQDLVFTLEKEVV